MCNSHKIGWFIKFSLSIELTPSALFINSDPLVKVKGTQLVFVKEGMFLSSVSINSETLSL